MQTRSEYFHGRRLLGTTGMSAVDWGEEKGGWQHDYMNGRSETAITHQKTLGECQRRVSGLDTSSGILNTKSSRGVSGCTSIHFPR